MTLALFRRRRHAFRVALVLLLSLLFQQVAIASYACPLEGAPPPASAAMTDCASMEVRAADPLCDEHCDPDTPTTPDARIVQVPPVALPPLRFELARSLPSTTRLQQFSRMPVVGTDPPPTLRFCSLLI